MALVCVVVGVAAPFARVMAFSSAMGSFGAVGVLRYMLCNCVHWEAAGHAPFGGGCVRVAIGHVIVALWHLVALCVLRRRRPTSR